ncbi:hypothetical protein IQ265_08320 [Nodosilinea sp. LEGE 06152]|uniref:hypothetical protein n=1 Tax=Nodosilinea sp. LEGE 06152 TaxID=2777966 RepID=UPI00187F0D0B|nr:hypothetical protein [Nodosilinea sp. LEGE 06152]MBE9156834.1 hypothetical protein [Nodosilinea sp. LEGE 06152]
MLCLPFLASSARGGAATRPPLLLANPKAQPGRERLRHLAIGSPEGVQGAINHLHLLQYAERLEWSRQFTIPESGILITPEQGEVFSLLLRDRQLG